MSVDQGHRKQFCTLLKTRFPETQFIITTHDKVWAKQMQTEGLVDSKGGIVFHSWSVQTGPIFEQLADVWDQIDKDLAKNDVSAAAARLRRHLEYISAELADSLGAKPPSAAISPMTSAICCRPSSGGRQSCSSSPRNRRRTGRTTTRMAKVEALKTARAEALAKHGGESWVVNKAVHYTEWADFSKAEFRSVVEAFKTLLLQFRCRESRVRVMAVRDAAQRRPGSAPLPLCEHQSQSQGEVSVMLPVQRELAALKFIDGLSAHLKDVREPHKALRHALRDTREFFRATHGCIATLRAGPPGSRPALHAAKAGRLGPAAC